jgi:hypothetical protein
MNTNNQLSVIGKSVRKPIYKYQIGEGKIKYCFGPRCMEMKVPPKGLFDFLNCLNGGSGARRAIV